jgi:flagellar motor switch/type III secretory pathway protein FliN
MFSQSTPISRLAAWALKVQKGGNGAAPKAVRRAAVIAPRHRPYPWASLDPTTREEADTRRVVRRWAAAHLRLEQVEAVLQELLAVRLELLVRRVQSLTLPRPIEDGVGVVLARAEAPDMAQGALVACEPALAITLVAHALRRPRPALLDVGASVSAATAGALAGILTAAARRAHTGAAFRVLAAGPAAALERELAQIGAPLVAVTATVLVADDAFAARVVVSRSAIAPAPPPTWNAAALTAAFGSAPLALPIVACTARATVAEVAALCRGDAWLPGTWPLRRGDGGAIVGPVWLAAPASNIAVPAELVAGGKLVLGGQVDGLGMAEAEMTESVEKGELLQAVGEVPVTVRVEIGEARMAAREWAALGRGDVIALGRRIGEPVLLRVGGVPVARGDLVEIDGEVGVRIVERTTGWGDAP